MDFVQYLSEMVQYIASFDTMMSTLLISSDAYRSLVIFTSVFLFGETAILIAFLLTQQGISSFEEVLVASVLGTVCADVFWFLLSRFFPQKMVPVVIQRRILGPTNTFLVRIMKGRIFLPMLFLRFFVGTRLVMVVYFARQKISFVRFLLYDTIGTTLYVCVFAFMGIGFGQLLHIYTSSYRIVLSVVLGILIVVCLWLMTRHVMSRNQV